MENVSFAKLSWTLLEHRIRYYVFDAPIIGDGEYDTMEKEYERRCKELGVENTITNRPGVDLTKESVQLAILKIKTQE